MGALKRYLHVQIKLYYMEGQLGKQRYRISEIYIYLGDVKRCVTSGWNNLHPTKRMGICMSDKGSLVDISIDHMFLCKKKHKYTIRQFQIIKKVHVESLKE